MRGFQSLNFTKLVFVAAFLFALNQNIFKHVQTSVQNKGTECFLNQPGKKSTKSDVLNKNLIETNILDLSVSVFKSVTFRVLLGGYLQLTIEAKL